MEDQEGVEVYFSCSETLINLGAPTPLLFIRTEIKCNATKWSKAKLVYPK